jgi:RsiW-degrading membrane proteinase PrsW (M82 family)
MDFSFLIVFAVYHIIQAFPLYIIAVKGQEENAWLAFVPVLNVFLMCQIADRTPLIFMLTLIPWINFAVYAMLWAEIAEYANKPMWMGVLMAIPGVQLYSAFTIAKDTPDDYEYNPINHS